MILGDFQDCAPCAAMLGDLGTSATYTSPDTRQQVKIDESKDGSWETYCDAMWPRDGAINGRCKAKGLNVVAMVHPPWDMAGARARNIPFLGKSSTEGIIGLIGGYILDPLNIFGIKSETPPPQGMTQAQANALAAQSGGKWVLPVGLGIGGILLLGLVYAGTR